MYKLGRKTDNMAVGKNEVYYPSVSLTSDEIPELDKKKIGSKVALKVIGILKGISQEKEGARYEIELRGCEPTTEIDEGEYDKMTDEEKDKIDREDVEEKSVIGSKEDDNEE